MLEITDVSFRYGPESPWLFRNLNLTVAPGAIVGLQGPSGQGKTTLARLIGGYLRPTTGVVTVNGARLPADGFCSVQLFFQHPELARISLVRALGPDVEYLIADEITSMLDALTQARIWRSLTRYSKQNRIGMLVISHDSALLKRLCPRIIHLVS